MQLANLTFLGTGEALDHRRTNASYLIERENKTIMVDVGYTAAYSLMKYLGDSNSPPILLQAVPDAVILTHLHGDHSGGIAPLLLQAYERGRTKPLVIYSDPSPLVISGKTVYSSGQDAIERLMDLQYSGILEKIMKQFPIEFRGLESKQDILGFKVRTAKTRHTYTNYALFIDGVDKPVAISGDGGITPECEDLYANAYYLIHDGFVISGRHGSHSSIEEVIEFAKKTYIPKVYFVHVNKDEVRMHKKLEDIFQTNIEFNTDFIIPDDFDKIMLDSASSS